MTTSDKEFEKFLKDNDTTDLLKKILRIYANDKNSSFLREMITCYVAGYEHCEDKLGYDGYFMGLPCEVKPQNVILNSDKKLDGRGNFTDFTWRKFKKCEEDNLKMLSSGFVDGKLLFIIEFPFNSKKFKTHLLKILNKFLPNGDEKNRYIRSCSWSFKYIDTMTVRYVAKNFRDYKNKMTKSVYNFLELGENVNVGPITSGK